MKSNFLNTIDKIILDLSNYKNSKKDLQEYYINNRLLESTNSYVEQINNSLKYLKNKDCLDIIKRLNRYG